MAKDKVVSKGLSTKQVELESSNLHVRRGKFFFVLVSYKCVRRCVLLLCDRDERERRMEEQP